MELELLLDEDDELFLLVLLLLLLLLDELAGFELGLLLDEPSAAPLEVEECLDFDAVVELPAGCPDEAPPFFTRPNSISISMVCNFVS